MTEPNRNPTADDSEDPQDPRLAELVAYLDGELDEDSSTRVERRLAQDPPLRQYAERLNQTWKLLDSLGEATASGEFTQKTIASLSTATVDDESGTGRSAATAGVLRWFRTAGPVKFAVWMVLGFTATMAGTSLGLGSRSGPEQSTDARLLRQLDLFRSYQRLWSVPDVAFLREVTAMDAAPAMAPSEPVVETPEGAPQ